jgi:DeoR/GlpR family transcriptional regulator of sugar metabolism
MIREILHIILNEGLTSTSEIAEKVGIQEETLKDILQLLQRRGYLRRSECTEEQLTPCSHCPSSGSCIKTAEKGQTFIITEKGKQIAKPLGGSV